MWRNYDDLNEFFWSEHSQYYVSLLPYLCLESVSITNQSCYVVHRSLECFEIGWPMRPEHDFFCVESLDTSKPGRWRGMLRFRKQTKKTDEEMEDDEELGVHISVTHGSLPLIMHLHIHT